MEKRIYFHDTDTGGIVYYGNYLKYLEEARTELLEAKGLTLDAFKMLGVMYAIAECSIKYRSPARYGDILICEARVKETTAVKFIFEEKITEKQTGRIVVESETLLVCINEQFEPTRIPEELKSRLFA